MDKARYTKKLAVAKESRSNKELQKLVWCFRSLSTVRAIELAKAIYGNPNSNLYTRCVVIRELLNAQVFATVRRDDAFQWLYNVIIETDSYEEFFEFMYYMASKWVYSKWIRIAEGYNQVAIKRLGYNARLLGDGVYHGDQWDYDVDSILIHRERRNNDD